MTAGRSTDGPRREVPFDVFAEEAVIAAILLDEDAIERVFPLVGPEDFYRETHAWTYEAACMLYGRGERITVPTIAHELDGMRRLNTCGGEVWLVELVGRHFTAAGVEAHARIVRRDALYRRLIASAGQIAQLAFVGGPDPDRVTAAVHQILDAATRGRVLRALPRYLRTDHDDLEAV